MPHWSVVVDLVAGTVYFVSSCIYYCVGLSGD